MSTTAVSTNQTIAQRKHYPETMLARTGFFTPAFSDFANESRFADFWHFESCLDAPEALAAGGSMSFGGISATFESRLVMRCAR